MLVFSTFESSPYVELALSALEEYGIDNEQILAVPLDNRKQERRLFDTLHKSDGVSLFDKGAALGTALSVIGASIGFNLKWGPIYWGLIGAAVGFLIGFLIDVYIHKVVHKQKRLLKGKTSEIVLVIECEQKQLDFVERTLWEHFAIGVSSIQK
ncbi:glycine zipper family protein [Cytobacillus spongiae]|nr:glycine zipper family protein [Cytobacillus spongiae]UII57923.1 glycine zipper family protein [Cytobacillus spongiae]